MKIIKTIKLKHKGNKIMKLKQKRQNDLNGKQNRNIKLKIIYRALK